MHQLADLFSNPIDEKQLLEGSYMFGCTLEHWIAQRKFITEAINLLSLGDGWV